MYLCCILQYWISKPWTLLLIYTTLLQIFPSCTSHPTLHTALLKVMILLANMCTNLGQFLVRFSLSESHRDSSIQKLTVRHSLFAELWRYKKGAKKMAEGVKRQKSCTQNRPLFSNFSFSNFQNFPVPCSTWKRDQQFRCIRRDVQRRPTDQMSPQMST